MVLGITPSTKFVYSLLRDDFGRLVFLYALKRTDSVLNL